MTTAPLFDADRLVRLRRLSAAVPSPCGTWLAVAAQRLDDEEAGYVSDLWRVSLVDPDEAPRRLTRGPCSDHSPRFRRDGALAFLSSRNPSGAAAADGDERRDQVWLLPAGGGEPVPLTDEPLGVTDFRLGAADDRLVVIADVLPGVAHEAQRGHAAERKKKGPGGLRFSAMPVRHWDSWLPVAAPHVIDYGTDGTRRDLTPEADREHRALDFGIEWDLSPDGRRVAISCKRPGPDRIEDVALRIIDIDTGAHRDLGVAPRTAHAQPHFSPDGTRLACVRDMRAPGWAERLLLWLFEGEDAEGRPVAGDWDAWPSLCAWTGDGAAVVATADTGGRVPVYRVDVGSGEVTRITAEAAGGSHGSVHVSGDAIVGLRHRMTHPPEPFRCELRAGAEPALLASMSGFSAAEGEAIAAIEELFVEAPDGALVQSFLLRPRDASAPAPALLWIHGGPMGQHADCWHWRWNPLVPAAAGYAVALPNPRGSTGFGQKFIQEIWNNEWGGACYRDLMAVTESVAARDDVDGDRIGAMGGSFGGYMANWMGASTDRFKCLVTHAGIFHLPAFSGTTDYPSFFTYQMGLGPYDDPEAFCRYSPHRGLDRWTTPTLIVHGERDYRVPVSEALLLFDALQTRGVESELLVFPDENHWILKPQNARQWYDTVLAFADRYL